MTKTGRQRTERCQALLAEPDTLRDLCEFIADRGTLQEWTRKHDVRYLEVHAWLHDVDFPDRLDRYTKALEARDSAFSDVVRSGLRDVVEADIRKLYDGGGRMLDPHKLPDELARVVQSVDEEETERGTKRKVRLESRGKGLELLGRSVGLYKDRVEHEGKLTLEELVGGSHQAHTPGITPGASASDSPPNPRSSRKH